MSDMASGKRKGKKQIDFIVTTSDPNDDQSNAANKKRVRSVAALKSWPERRKKIFEQLESSGNGQGAFLVDDGSARSKSKSTSPSHSVPIQFIQQPLPLPLPAQTIPSPPAAVPSKAKRPKSYGPSPPATATQPPTCSLNPGAQVFVPTSTSPTGDLSAEVVENIERKPSAIGSSMALYRKVFAALVAQDALNHTNIPGVLCPCRHCSAERRIASTHTDLVSISETVIPPRRKRMADGSEKSMEFRGDMAMITPPTSPSAGPLTGKMEPFGLYPVQYKPWFDQILHHMMTVYAPRGWPALKISDEQGVKWEWFMTQNSLSEPALFYVRLLFGSGDMIRLGTLRTDIMYWLRAEAIKAINEALGDPKRSCSDALILAVGRIALHEHMYGDKYASSKVHRPAQKRMIEMRGGMKGLDFPDLVKRLMRWSDRIMAVGSGTERMLEDDDANPNFTLRQSVGAIECWAPHEMPGVRSKIRISDLINDEDES